MIVVSLRSVTLAAVVATAVVAFGCGDDADGPEAPAATTPTSELVTPSPTPAATAVSPTDERLQEILDAPGLLSFLSNLEDAIEANDVQFVIDHTHFAAYECQSTSGFPAEPDECWGAPGHTLPAISYGFWQSEGGYWTEATYEAAISDRLTGPDAKDARMYAIGQMSLGGDPRPADGPRRRKRKDVRDRSDVARQRSVARRSRRAYRRSGQPRRPGAV